MRKKEGTYDVSTPSKEQPENNPSRRASFEEAISAAGFGKFNFFLLIVGGFPICQATMYSMTNLAQIIPSLKCDFNLNVRQIGILNASPFLGNIASPFLWGYLADKYGRKKVIMWTCIFNGILESLIVFSINLEMIIVFKFLAGFLITAPLGIIMSYMAECHNVKHRSTMIMSLGVLIGTANFFLPALAWAILPRNFNIDFLKSWKIYLIITSIPSIIGGIAFIFIPESPKFLIAAGYHDEALKVFQKIYSMNTGKPKNSYPITKLQCNNQNDQQKEEKKTSIKQAIKNNCQQFKPLLHKPYVTKLILSLLLQGCLMMGVNTLRTWLPEILTLMDEYKKNNNGSSTTLCHIIQLSLNKTDEEQFANNTIVEKSCSQVQNSDDVYMVLCIIGVASIVFYIFFTITSSIFNPKYVLACTLIVSGVSGIALIWIENAIGILVIAAGYTTQTGVALVTLVSIVVDLFPTKFRTTTVLLCSTSGRVTSVLGNLILPVLFQNGCVPAFIFLGGCVLVCLIPLFLLPSEKEEE